MRTAARAPRLSSGTFAWAALVTVYIAWGSTYIGIRLMDRTVPPLIGAGIRYLCAGGAMYAFLAWRRGGAPRMSWRELGSVALVAVLLLCGGNGFVSLAEKHVPAGLASLVVASVPLWVLLLRFIGREHLNRATLAGLGIGFVGVALLVLRGREHGVSVAQLLIVLGASFSWALGSWASGRLPMPADAAASTAAEMLIGGVGLAVLGPLLGEHWSAVGHASAQSLEAILYLALFGSILAFTAYVWLLQNMPISRVSTYAYVNPLVAVLLGGLLLGEQITLNMVLGGTIILAAVAVVIRGEPSRKPEPEPEPARALATITCSADTVGLASSD